MDRPATNSLDPSAKGPVPGATGSAVDAVVELEAAREQFARARERLHRAVETASHFPELQPHIAVGAGLTHREIDVLGAIGTGASNEDIAQRFFIGINSLKTYVRTGYRKI